MRKKTEGKTSNNPPEVTLKDYYAYDHIEAVVDAYFEKKMLWAKSSLSARAWRRIKLLARVFAISDWSAGPHGHWGLDNQSALDKPPEAVRRRKALGWAWQEIEVAFKGQGDNLATGAVVYFWDHIPEENQEPLRLILQQAFEEAHAQTAVSVERAFRLKHFKLPVLPKEGPWKGECHVPLFGVYTQLWAKANVEDPEAFCQIQADFEELERLNPEAAGVEVEPDIEFKEEPVKVRPPSPVKKSPGAMPKAEEVEPPKKRKRKTEIERSKEVEEKRTQLGLQLIQGGRKTSEEGEK